jgi:hypothetical protein
MAKSCTRRTKVAKIKLEERGRKAIFENPKSHDFDITCIDGCLIKNGPRADFLVSKVGSCSVLVELKGKDLSHAYLQLETSLNSGPVAALMERKKGLLIICSRVPSADTTTQKAQQRFRKEYRIPLTILCNQRDLDIEKISL